MSSVLHPFGGRISRHLGNSQLAPEDAYLSYYDVRLTKLDVDSVKNDWLTDNAISFWEEYLERERLNHIQGPTLYFYAQLWHLCSSKPKTLGH